MARFGVTLSVVTLTPARWKRFSSPASTAGDREQVAGLIEMLCHDEAGFATAQCFSVVSAVS